MLSHISTFAFHNITIMKRMAKSNLKTSLTLTAYMRQLIDALTVHGRLGTARNYRRTLNSVAACFSNSSPMLSDISESLIATYNAYLQRRGVVRNTISFYMRILRAVYNKAVAQGLVNPPLRSPFADVYTGIDRTHKRAVGSDIITLLARLDLTASPSLALARDMFICSFCTRGMAFVDMAFLRTSDIHGNNIRYARHKTSQRLTVHIEPPVRDIIRRYSSSTSDYIFPIITSADPRRAYTQYQVALNYHNRLLKRLGAMIGLKESISTYTARHSWATAARNCGVPVSVISAGMGHSSEHTTQIYLASLDAAAIDAANSRIIAGII